MGVVVGLREPDSYIIKGQVNLLIWFSYVPKTCRHTYWKLRRTEFNSVQFSSKAAICTITVAGNELCMQRSLSARHSYKKTCPIL